MGSCLAGLLFGALKLQTPLHRLLLLGGAATAATTLPLLLVGSIPALAAAVLVAGLFFAPTMIVAMSLVERLVPERRLTEGMAWLLAGLNVGVALGAAASGQVVDEGGAWTGFAVALCAGALVLLVALWGHQRLRAQPHPYPTPRDDGTPEFAISRIRAMSTSSSVAVETSARHPRGGSGRCRSCHCLCRDD